MLARVFEVGFLSRYHPIVSARLAFAMHPIGALIGPAQVLARIIEASFLSRYHPIVSTKLAFLMHPLGALIVALTGGAAAGVFAIFHGAGNGVITISRGTLPLAIFGPKNYAYRLGLIGAPARMAQAPAPLVFGLLIDLMGSRVLIVSSALSLVALGALFLLRLKSPPPDAQAHSDMPAG